MDPSDNKAGGTATATPPAPAAPVNQNVAARDQWLATAGGGSAPKTAAAPSNGGGAAQAPAAGASLPQQGPPAQPPVAPVVTSMKRGGLLGVMDSVTDALVGKTRPELGTDAQGTPYVKQHTLTRGEQWVRIAGEAMRGAAAGLAAGKGAGNMGKAAVAGIQSQEQGQDREMAQVRGQVQDKRQEILDNANNQMLRMNMAEQTWRASRLQVEANEHDIAFWQGQEDRLTKAGATEIGTVAHPGDLTGALKVNPTMMEDLVKHHSLEFVPNVEDGVTKGFKVFKTSQGYRDTFMPAGSEFPSFNSVTGEFDWHRTVEPTTQGALDDYWTAAGNAAMKFKSDKKEQEVKDATAANLRSEQTARDTELPGKIAQTKAQTVEAYAGAEQKRAEASKVPSEIAKNWGEAHAAEAKAIDDAEGNGQGPAGEALVDSIGRGQMPVGRLAYILARKPELLAAVVKKYPGFDGSRIDSYVKAYQDFTSGKTSVQLNAGGTALMHLAALEKLNTEGAYVPFTPANKDYMNQATTLATELAKFYGDATIPAIDKIYKSLTGVNRGTAISRQAQSMSKKMDEYRQQWENASPSAVYEAQMPRLAPEAEAARIHFDPQYRDWVAKHQQDHPEAQPPTTAAPGAWTPPANAPAAPQVDNKYLYDPQGNPVAKSMGGQWVKP